MTSTNEVDRKVPGIAGDVSNEAEAGVISPHGNVERASRGGLC